MIRTKKQKQSLIILDNACYHKRRPEIAPNASKLRKYEILIILHRMGVNFESEISGIEKRAILRG